MGLVHPLLVMEEAFHSFQNAGGRLRRRNPRDGLERFLEPFHLLLWRPGEGPFPLEEFLHQVLDGSLFLHAFLLFFPSWSSVFFPSRALRVFKAWNIRDFTVPTGISRIRATSL